MLVTEKCWTALLGTQHPPPPDPPSPPATALFTRHPGESASGWAAEVVGAPQAGSSPHHPGSGLIGIPKKPQACSTSPRRL